MVSKRLQNLFNLRIDLDHPDEIDADIRSGVALNSTNLWVLVFAMLIASVGLNVNSTPVIIGAMLISPLMGPIAGAGYALALGDAPLLRTALRNLGIFTLISLGASSIYFLLSPLTDAGSELVARTNPTIWDVLIAFFGGAAGMVAITRRSIANALPGVAIATALMPPLCTAGFALAHGKWDWFGGAIYLFGINAVFIGFATLLFAKLMRLPLATSSPANSRRRWLGWLTLAAMLGPSIYFGLRVVKDRTFERDAQAAIQQVQTEGRAIVLASNISPQNKSIQVTIAGGGPSAALGERLAEALQARGHAPRVNVRTAGGDLDVETLRDSLRKEVANATRDAMARVRTTNERSAEADALALIKQREATFRQLELEIVALFPSVAQAYVGVRDHADNNVFVLLTPKQAKASTPKQLVPWLAERLPGTTFVVGTTVTGPPSPPTPSGSPTPAAP